jgi:hypothetical protein
MRPRMPNRSRSAGLKIVSMVKSFADYVNATPLLNKESFIKSIPFLKAMTGFTKELFFGSG